VTGWAYWDTSALGKHYVREAGREAVGKLLDDLGVASSRLLPVELESMLQRRAREHRLDAAEWDLAQARVERDRQAWELRAVDDAVLTAAARVIRVHGARTLDAIHLATAELFRAALDPGLPFITADRRQAEIAAALGLSPRVVG
jgi:predicted nucleic acid-binding protein